MDRLSDIMRQGFMRGLKPARAKAIEKPVVACQECLNWHREGKHTADAATRKARRVELREKGKI